MLALQRTFAGVSRPAALVRTPLSIQAAHKKGAGSTKNGRDSNSQRRGVKVLGGQHVKAGGIIIRQVGSTVSGAPGSPARRGAARRPRQRVARTKRWRMEEPRSLGRQHWQWRARERRCSIPGRPRARSRAQRPRPWPLRGCISAPRCWAASLLPRGCPAP